MILSEEKPHPDLIPIEQLVLWEEANVRKEDALLNIDELAGSIKEHGVMVPLFVKEKEPHKLYLVFSGQRRLEACKIAGVKKVPCFIFRTISLVEAKVLSFSENLYRESMTADDKSRATNELYKKMHDFRRVANALGVKESTVRHYLRYNDIPEELRRFSKPELGGLGSKEIEDIYFKFLDIDRAIAVAKKLASYRKGTVQRKKYHEAVRRSSRADNVRSVTEKAERLIRMKKFVILLPDTESRTIEKIAFARKTTTEELMTEILEQWVEEYLKGRPT